MYNESQAMLMFNQTVSIDFIGQRPSRWGNNTLIRHIVTGPEDPKMVDQAGHVMTMTAMGCGNQ